MTPLLVYLLAGAWVEVSFFSMVISVVKVVLIPVLLGIFLRWIIGRQIEKLSGILPLISVVSIVMIISGIVAVNAEKILTSGFAVLCIVILHNLAGMGLGLGASRPFSCGIYKSYCPCDRSRYAEQRSCYHTCHCQFCSQPICHAPGSNLQRIGTIFPALYSQVYVVMDITRKTPRKLERLKRNFFINIEPGFSHPRCICKEFFTKFTPCSVEFLSFPQSRGVYIESFTNILIGAFCPQWFHSNRRCPTFSFAVRRSSSLPGIDTYIFEYLLFTIGIKLWIDNTFLH